MNKTELGINAVRILSAEAIQKANSGHPGLPLGSAPIGFTLYSDFLKFNPKNPNFDDRDRFVLSAGHGSAMLYSLLHIFGYAVSMEDLKNFRQLGSKTPGHPEYKHTPGVETTTGPLGQGIAAAVGMAIAETHLAAKFNREGFPVCDHYTYALCGDGCMQEGIESEAASLAGTLALGKLILFYDDNEITIEGNTDVAFTEDVAARHKAYGWQVIDVKDGNDPNAIKKAIKRAKAETEKPSLIICHTQIGFGSPLQGSQKCHGSPLGEENLQKTKENLGWTAQPFTLPDEVKAIQRKAVSKGKRIEKAWKAMFAGYSAAYPELAEEYKNWMGNKLPDLIGNEDLWSFPKPDATRGSSFTVLNKLSELVPNLFGGSADLAPSNKSNMKNREYYSKDNRLGSNVHYGIREHAMAAITNGLICHGGLNCYCATFFVFSDYMKNAMRLAAMMKLPAIYILTHDSIGVGEDGCTHQPVEQLVGLRSVPGMDVFRPCDNKETTAAWISALTANKPTCLILTRQTLAQNENSGVNALKGGYIISDSQNAKPDVILIASGSEVELIVKAQAVLREEGIDARVVSMPCMEIFEAQTAAYKQSVIPKNVRARVCVEAGSAYSWYKYSGLDGEIISMDCFGASGPADQLFEKYGFTVANVVEKAKKSISNNKK